MESTCPCIEAGEKMDSKILGGILIILGALITFLSGKILQVMKKETTEKNQFIVKVIGLIAVIVGMVILIEIIKW